MHLFDRVHCLKFDGYTPLFRHLIFYFFYLFSFCLLLLMVNFWFVAFYYHRFSLEPRSYYVFPLLSFFSSLFFAKLVEFLLVCIVWFYRTSSFSWFSLFVLYRLIKMVAVSEQISCTQYFKLLLYSFPFFFTSRSILFIS